MISRVLPSRLALLARPAVFSFCGQQPEAQDEQKLDKAANFYRNSVRRINIDRQGRGKFTEHALLRMAKLTENSQQVPLLFEAYYNYLGHFTVISNSSVDKMLHKVMDIPDAPLEQAIELYSTHNYLSYFPHYSTTLRLISLVQADEESFTKLLHIFEYSPLIRFDRPIIDHLLAVARDSNTSDVVFGAIVKLLRQRADLGIIKSEISKKVLLEKLERYEKARPQEEGEPEAEGEGEQQAPQE